MTFLSSKAILCSIIYILITYYDLESKVQNIVEKKQPHLKRDKYEVIHPTLVSKA